MAALAIRDDVGPDELRRQARREHDGRVSARLIGSPMRWTGWTGRRRRGWREWTGRPCAIGFTATTPKGWPGCPIGRCRALAEIDRRADGLAEMDRAARPGPGGGPGRALADRRSVPGGGRALGRRLQRDRDAASLVVARSVAPQDPPGSSANRCEGARRLQKRGFAARLSEIVAAHPEAERFEIWSQDEARVGQKGRTGYIWWQRGHTPRGRRDLGHRSAWIIGAVARPTRLALVMTRLDTAAMNLFLAELAQAIAPGAHAVVLMDKAGWHIADELVVRQCYAGLPAALLAGANRAVLALPQR